MGVRTSLLLLSGLLIAACGSDGNSPTDARGDGAGERPDAVSTDSGVGTEAGGGDGAATDTGAAVDGSADTQAPTDTPVEPAATDGPADAAVVDLPVDTATASDLPPDLAPPAPAKCGDPGAPCPTIDPFCTADANEPPTTMQSGSLAIGPSIDIVGLCGGWVLIGDRKQNQIVVRNAFTGDTKKSYQLTGAPGDLELDREQGVLYSTLDAATAVARLDLKTDTLTSIPVSAPASGLAVGAPGMLFAMLAGSFDRKVAFIDTGSGAVKREQMATFGGELIVFDRVRTQLIIGNTGLSPSGLSRWTFDAGATTLTMAQGRQAGSNGQDLAISPDYARIAYPNGAGNSTPGYTVVDYSSADLNVTAGAWNTGPYPRGAAFSPDGARLAASNGNDLIVFGVTTHAEVARVTPALTSCPYGTFGKVAWSRSSRYVFTLSHCQFDRREGLLVWYRPPTP
jgi:hypothetical protein